MQRLLDLHLKAATAYNNGNEFDKNNLAESAYNKFKEAHLLYQKAREIVETDPDLKHSPTEAITAFLGETETRCQLIHTQPKSEQDKKSNETQFQKLDRELYNIKCFAAKNNIFETYRERLKSLEMLILHKKFVSKWNTAITIIESTNLKEQKLDEQSLVVYDNTFQKGMQLAQQSIELLSTPHISRNTIHSYFATGVSDQEEARNLNQHLIKFWDQSISTLSDAADEQEKINPAFYVAILKKIHMTAMELHNFHIKNKTVPEVASYFTIFKCLEDLYHSTVDRSAKKEFLSVLTIELNYFMIKHEKQLLLNKKDKMEFLTYKFFSEEQSKSTQIHKTATRVIALLKKFSPEELALDPWINELADKAKEFSTSQNSQSLIIDTMQKKRKIDHKTETRVGRKKEKFAGPHSIATPFFSSKGGRTDNDNGQEKTTADSLIAQEKRGLNPVR